ncbi:hypothetical protein FQU76_07410 [Streptomyces qinzhouensis]|uniref:Uncharacterized protein n=1 Tax=Streptomyces qinzhouensis TaxID=2599401 RepID=A0A5B8J7N7_9ACTN|nr:hypothetical protein FQU76_07410 [Streptomyces qinzhouensis]
MPSLTVWVSSDTDICFITPGMGSPHRGRGRYGDCLPTLQPARPRIHSGPGVVPLHARTSPRRGRAGVGAGPAAGGCPIGRCVTLTLSRSSK